MRDQNISVYDYKPTVVRRTRLILVPKKLFAYTIVMIIVIFGVVMITVSKGVLKAKMLEYFRQVEKNNEELIVTDHHKPVLRIIAIKQRKLPTDVFKEQGHVMYFEDINAPTCDEWDQIK